MEQFNKWLLTDEGQILVGDQLAKAVVLMWRAALGGALSNINFYYIEEGTIKKELGNE